MRIREGFELVNIAEEYIAVPVGDEAESFDGMIVLNEAAAFLIESMKHSVTIEELVDLLTEHFDVDRDTAYKDIEEMLGELTTIGLITD